MEIEDLAKIKVGSMLRIIGDINQRHVAGLGSVIRVSDIRRGNDSGVIEIEAYGLGWCQCDSLSYTFILVLADDTECTNEEFAKVLEFC